MPSLILNVYYNRRVKYYNRHFCRHRFIVLSFVYIITNLLYIFGKSLPVLFVVVVVVVFHNHIPSLMNHAPLQHGGALGTNDNSLQGNDEPDTANLSESFDAATGREILVANRDIAEGEEFLIDYMQIHVWQHSLDWFEASRRSHTPDDSLFVRKD
jgi:hypothetical protein